jgi:hypothetical protein
MAKKADVKNIQKSTLVPGMKQPRVVNATPHLHPGRQAYEPLGLGWAEEWQ